MPEARRLQPASPEYCDPAGALRLRAQIEDYWRQRGASVTVTIERTGFMPAMRGAFLVIRSDMRNGLPASESVTP